MENWIDVYDHAKQLCTKCRCCRECNGLVCRGETPGPGGKGSGSSFIRNVSMLKEVYITMDTISGNEEIDTTSDFFGHQVALPVYAAPISGIEQNYGAPLDDVTYTKQLVEGCLKAGSIAFSGDGMFDDMFKGPMSVVKEHDGYGVPTIKPWDKEHMKWRIDLAREANVLAIASDIDASGLTNLRKSAIKVGFKSVEELKEIKEMCQVPFIVKGIMSTKGALKALEAGVDGIIVSNHGGRVIDDCLSGIEVLEEIVKVVDGKMKVFVDGGFRSGLDVFKALALGADGVLIGRPLSLSVIGDGSNGVKLYMEKIQNELKEAMAMSGCKNIKDITKDKVTSKL
ncbi:MAG: alpha-hydroxy-acid oxidizing protein [Longicatena sp.]